MRYVRLFLKNQKTAMRVAEARGVISYEAVLAKLDICEYSPPQIKVAVTGHGGSDNSLGSFQSRTVSL